MIVRFYLDEDVQVFLAEALRVRGVDTLHVYEAGHGGQDDDAQLAFAAAEGRCIVSYNRGDFVRLVRQYADAGLPHAGVVVAVRRTPGDVLRSLVAISAAHTAESLKSRLLFA